MASKYSRGGLSAAAAGSLDSRADLSFGKYRAGNFNGRFKSADESFTSYSIYKMCSFKNVIAQTHCCDGWDTATANFIHFYTQSFECYQTAFKLYKQTNLMKSKLI